MTSSTVNTAPPALLGYKRRQGTFAMLYDEFLLPDGKVRPHWEEIGGYFANLGPEEITRRWNQARKILRNNGVAYNVSAADLQGSSRSWELNPIPLRIPAGEWSVIESAVRQRGRLLNAILNDLYGGQDLLREGLIPPALILANGAYLRPCVGVPVPHGARLSFYAVDLARSPDGAWWVLSDRTQAPSGAGYALENRVVLSRVLPEIFQSAQIARLGGFFRQMKEAIEALSPRPGLRPTVVLLTPGRLSETYFEHAYLARQLNFTLVEGQDLTVRNNTVYIRTLLGLQQVDVVLRRVDDDYCDPLELRDESLLGVPGLMNAVRAGTVSVANSLGSGVVQCPALGAFLPKLCERLLDEKLLMPSVATWWCGQPKEQKYVLDNLHGLVVQPAFDFPGERPVEGAGGDIVRGAILRRPEFFSAQEMVRLSQCPDFNGERIEPRSVILRIFAVRNGDDYIVMPGGLTRVAEEELSHGVLLRTAGSTKDTWVDLADTEPFTPPSTRPAREGELRRASPPLTSRVADSFFWLGRYSERAEFSARMTRTTLDGLASQQVWEEMTDFHALLQTLNHFGQFHLPPGAEEPSQIAQALASQMIDRENSGSVATIVERLRDVITSVRDQVTADTWRIANQLPYLLPQPGTTDVQGGADFDLNAVILHLSALNGVLGENMMHGSGWRFVELGRRLERSAYSARLLAESLDVPHPNVSRYEVLLDVFDAVITYRQKYTVVQRATVLDLLLCDESNPRSLASQLALLHDDIINLPRESDAAADRAGERLALRTLSDVRLLDVRNLDSAALIGVEEAMLDLSSLITRLFFMHLRTSSVGRDVASPALPDTV